MGKSDESLPRTVKKKSDESWKIINSILKPKRQQCNKIELQVDNCSVNDPIEVANVLNNYFATIGSSLANDIPTNNVDPS